MEEKSLRIGKEESPDETRFLKRWVGVLDCMCVLMSDVGMLIACPLGVHISRNYLKLFITSQHAPRSQFYRLSLIARNTSRSPTSIYTATMASKCRHMVH